MSFLQVVSCGSAQSAASFLFFTDKQRYLFNCGEGSQRICCALLSSALCFWKAFHATVVALAAEHKVKLSKINHLFFSSTRWDCIGGLFGELGGFLIFFDLVFMLTPQPTLVLRSTHPRKALFWLRLTLVLYRVNDCCCLLFFFCVCSTMCARTVTLFCLHKQTGALDVTFHAPLGITRALIASRDFIFR